MEDQTKNQDAAALYKVLAKLQSEEEIQAFIADLCTPAEIKALTERWSVARILEETDLSYRDINAQTGVSTTTIARVARFLKTEPHQGYRLALDKLKDE